MFQRKANMKPAALGHGDRISLSDLIKFCQNASIDLGKNGDEDASVRFEILADYLRNDFRGGKLTYDSTILGL